MRRDLSSDIIRFRSIEQEQIETIHKRQNEDCTEDVSYFLENDQYWTPMSKDQIKTKIEEIQKKDRTSIFAIMSTDDQFIGIAIFGAGWDPWSPYFHVLVWPEHRRKGLGTEAANILLDASFNNYQAHVTCCTLLDINEGGTAFAESLGFKNQGAQRRVGMSKGRYVDSIHFDILKDEYLEIRSNGGNG